MQEKQVQPLGWEDLLEEEMTTYFSILTWRISWAEEPGSLSLSHIWLFMTQWTAACQASLSFSVSQSLLKLMSIESVMPSKHFILCCPLLLLPKSLPASGSFLVSQHFPSGGQNIGASTSASVLPMNIQGWSPCSPRDSRESSPTPQFKSINSLALSLLYCPTLTFIHDYWKNHSLD